VRVIGAVRHDGGRADVYLDGQKQLTLIDCWCPSEKHQQVLYARSGLDNTRHKLEIVVTGAGNPASQGPTVLIDAVQYSDEPAASDFGAGGGPQSAQRMIFGYPKREDYVDKEGHAWRPATEWVIRSGYGQDTVARSWWTRRRSIFIGGTEDQELYRYGAHGDEFWVNLTVGPGAYFVRLHFASTPLHSFLERNDDGQPISQTIDVMLNDQRVLHNMNIPEEAGGTFRALIKTFENIQPANGSIEVWVKACDNQGACLQALEVGPMADR
jgi:hypothetical protein